MTETFSRRFFFEQEKAELIEILTGVAESFTVYASAYRRIGRETEALKYEAEARKYLQKARKLSGE